MKHNENTNWIELLRHFEMKRYIGHGLTIPFLVGIYKQSYNGSKEHLLDSFLGELKKLVLSGNIKINYCSYLEEDVISTASIIHTIDTSQVNDVKIEEYNQKYNSIIKKGLFSKTGNKWRPYTILDIERIKAARDAQAIQETE